jgi:hypothetical protein
MIVFASFGIGQLCDAALEWIRKRSHQAALIVDSK